MSEGLDGYEDCIFYQYHLVGGPKDGEVSTGLRPYFRLAFPQDGGVYAVPKEIECLGPEEYVEWLNDNTRKIVLVYQGT